MPAPTDEPPRTGRAATIVTALVVVAAVATTIAWMALRAGRNPVASADGPAPATLIDAAPAAARADAAVAPAADAGVPDARTAPGRRDAGPPRRLDAGTLPPRGTGRIKVSAIPYGDVYIDGKKVGRTPDEWALPTGKHKITVRFMHQTHTFQVTIDPDEIEPLSWDFTANP